MRTSRFCLMIFGVNIMPVFKKAGGRIFGVQFNSNEQSAVDQEIKRQIVENDRKFSMDQEAAILWMLHTRFRFGAKRLKEAWRLMYAEKEALREHYEMPKEDETWLCLRKLKELGVDLEELYREEGVADAQTVDE